MSFIRASLTTAQAIAHHYAMTPPNPTKEDTRYHKEEWWVLQIAPFIFRMHSVVLWVCACFETLSYLSALQTRSSLSLFTCPVTADASIRTTPMFLIGSLALFLGAYIRLDCFKALGHLFTFDLTVHSDHKLITDRFYGYVRHPAYTGSLLLVAGITFSHFTEGSWLTECGPLQSPMVVSVVWAAWWAWVVAVALSRVKAEDTEMKKRFSQQWEEYAIEVPWWFFPGIA
ncbi:hypothetical protein Moror_10201 [Moniliophthora roreri MCA 2997]|uniref:Protein-S-isoprenylcysteine O-methyltransferase n=2 Tax=Moniliophthora roreri TaxID=221103 RepID=V2WUW2_MONRO|nr:hypothetical protein Moror_10201 [Moniliophthora roreri MCA 2997]KAI3615659.1 hypothetical protein WG66_011904 [Moniliophthora roreri]